MHTSSLLSLPGQLRSGIILPTLLVAACVDSSPTPVSRRAAPLLNGTYDFVVSGVAIDFPEATARAGFNLDHLFSTSAQASGCNHRDFLSTHTRFLHENACLPEEGPCQGGVDNVLPELVDLLEHTTGHPLRGAANDTILGGHAVLLLRVTDVDDLTYDSFVDVRIYHGFAKSSVCTESFGGAGLFYVDNASLHTPGDLDTPRWRMQGSIIEGKLHVTNAWSLAAGATLAIPIKVDLGPSSTLSVGVHQMSLYSDATAFAGTSPFTVNLGGWLHTDTFSLALENTFPSHASQIFQLMPRLSDLPNPTTSACDTGTPLAQGGLSVGANLTLTSAVLYGTADTPGSGVCGTTW